MDRCPKCQRMTAERNHWTGRLICYARDCNYEEPAKHCPTCGKGLKEKREEGK